MGGASLENYNITDYLEIEEQSDLKHEYHNGFIVAMSGGTINHSIIGNSINGLIFNLLRDNNNCISMNSDVKIFVEKATSFVYPDGAVVCGGIETADVDAQSIINPKLVIEVLSKSTERYDRGAKYRKYCSLPSFCEYVLIDQYQPIVDTLYRSEKGSWKMMTRIGLDKSIYLHSIKATIKLEDIYRNAINLKQPEFMLDF